MSKIFTVAIIGVGGRGGYAYGTLMADMPDKFKISALCDINTEKLSYFAGKFGVPSDGLFTNEVTFFEKKRADALIISTQDKDHVRHAKLAFNLGYDILIEKPITSDKEELEELLALGEKTGCKALVCHVLRYAPAYTKIAELIEGGKIGRLVCINAIEQVGYLHQSQSFVRGSWRRESDSAPMILAKCSHDLDLIQYYIGSTCETLSSVGELSYFKEENAPQGAADRCLECRYADTCHYSAKTYYLDAWMRQRTEVYPYNVVCHAPITEERMVESLKHGPYGRCVYKCDNDVVDHQLTQMTFKNGVKASLTMIGFTRHCGRRFEFFGTDGQITLDEVRGFIRVSPFGEAEHEIKISDLTPEGTIHGGGDLGLVLALYDTLSGHATEQTSLTRSAESHLIGIAAEHSRKLGGALVNVH